MSDPIRLNLEGMRQLIQERAEHCKIVTIRAHTIPSMNKTGNPFHGKIFKDAKVNGAINWNYQSSVNRQRVREDSEPDFVPEPRKWGTRILGTPFVEHKGKVYIELKGERRLEEVYRDLATGEPMPDQDEIRKWVKAPYDPSDHQGLDKAVHLRDYTLSNLREIRINGEVFEMVVPQDETT